MEFGASTGPKIETGREGPPIQHLQFARQLLESTAATSLSFSVSRRILKLFFSTPSSSLNSSSINDSVSLSLCLSAVCTSKLATFSFETCLEKSHDSTLLPLYWQPTFAPLFLSLLFGFAYSVGFSLCVSLGLLSRLLHCREMQGDVTVHDRTAGGGGGGGGDQSRVLDIYPLSSYYFGSKDALAFKEETLADRVNRMKSHYAAHGLRTCVGAVIVVELFRHPHLLLLQVRNSTFKLPGGRLRPGESDVEGLKRKLTSKLSADGAGDETQWEVGECLGMWWRPDFETLPYPYLPPNVKKPKECTKLFLVKLPVSRKFIVPKNLKLLAVPLCQIHENLKTYGPVIAGVPQLLSKFSFNIIDS
ncbi:pre-mRNA cleavage factor Im 25 kDa subunit 1-like [Rhodamnia argentea]|uniref:Cleavage and polyadenylation specificity factor subunit 5 n=1 Tax=Rhodamnia argentea TaxID=178133 RepID=A0ABM3HAY8_9MYRT|nr:pre-mRNA cleavage factor Im 25 kDa subunit 1-like [Rhodamnia argentea]